MKRSGWGIAEILWVDALIPMFTQPYAPDPFSPQWVAFDIALVVSGAFVFVLLPLIGSKRSRAMLQQRDGDASSQKYLVHLRVDEGEPEVGVLSLDNYGPRFLGEDETRYSWPWSDVVGLEIDRLDNIGPEFLAMTLSSGERIEAVAQNRWGNNRASAVKQYEFIRAVRRARDAAKSARP